jgi:nondiscriminating aspartyl-tRNA synthetase
MARRAGERVLLRGWLQHQRTLASVRFLILRDAWGTAQVSLPSEAASAPVELTAESAIEVEGLAVADRRAPGGVEIRDAEIRLISPSKKPLPVDLFRPTIDATLPTLLDHAAVSLRHERRRAAFRLMDASAAAYRASLRHEGFTEIFTPKIVGAATESGASCFSLDYFRTRAYLAQSPQLYKQIMVGVFERVFEVGPVFRAEPHDTPRHLNEYVSLDAEIGFITDHHDVMALLQRTVAAMARAVSESPDVHAAGERMPVRMPSVFPALHFTEALELLAEEFGREVVTEPDLAPAHERWLGDWALSTHDSDFLFVVGFPLRKRPFYTHPDPARPDHSNGFDLLFRGLELATGGQRLHLLADYETVLAERRIDPAPFAGYLEAFQHGMPPHGGFAIGLERWVMQLVGAANLRETTLFPRDLNRLQP